MNKILESPKGGRKQRKTKNLLINPKYQLKYVFWVTFSGFVISVVNSLIFYFYIKENYEILVDLGPTTDEVKAQLYSELYQIIIKLSAFSLTFLVGAAVLGIIFSHRTAGPMYHFMKVFEQIKKGDHKARIRLRPGDDFQDVATAFNQMIEEVQTHDSNSKSNKKAA